MIEELDRVYRGDGFRLAIPATRSIEPGAGGADLIDSVVFTAEAPVLVSVAVERASVDTPSLQVAAALGALLSRYRSKGGFGHHPIGPVVVDGADEAEAAELRFGDDPRHAVVVVARLARGAGEVVILQVHVPAPMLDELRPLVTGIVDSLRVDPGLRPGPTIPRYDELAFNHRRP